MVPESFVWLWLPGLIILITSILLLLIHRQRQRSRLAFFHPYSSAGGGGERVLWVAIHAILTRTSLSVVVYSEYSNKVQVLRAVESSFGILFPTSLSSRITFIQLYTTACLQPKYYPIATMFMQSLGSILVAIECSIKHPSMLVIDTMGVPFTYPIFRIFGANKIIAYVHYPIISTDMLDKVAMQRPSSSTVTSNVQQTMRTELKLIYYHMFAWLYSKVGFYANTCLVNSTWTEQHIRQLWKNHSRIEKLYPPCNTSSLVTSISITAPRSRIVLSVGQFRREKDHALQIEAIRRVQRDANYSDVILVIIGGIRGIEDRVYLHELFSAARMYCDGEVCDCYDEVLEGLGGLSRSIGGIKFVVNAQYSVVLKWLGKASVGLHTMWNEHFGISIGEVQLPTHFVLSSIKLRHVLFNTYIVHNYTICSNVIFYSCIFILVEMMAAGLFVVGHNSGGPKLDILHDLAASQVCYLASSVEEYVIAIKSALDKANQGEDTIALRELVRSSAGRFSDAAFANRFVDVVVEV